MKLILLKDVEKLGDEGEIVTVKDGFGRNYLIPQGLAVIATPGAVRARQEEIRQASRKRAQAKEEAEATRKQLEDMEVVIAARTGEENRIFGSVTSQQIAVELANRGFDVDRRKIDLSEDIRMIGVYTASVKLHPDVTAQVKVRVISESGEIEA